MPKIPRIDGGRPSTPSGSATPNVGAAPAFDALGKLTDTGYAVAADAEKVHHDRLQTALEAKQAIVNEVEAGRQAGDYEESLVGYAEGLKKQYFDQPEKAPGQLLEVGRQLADRQLEQASNSQVGLAVVQRANARLDAAVGEMHTWAQGRQTQKAKNDLSITINRATAAAEGVPNSSMLEGFINSKVAELAPTFQKVLGPAEAEKAVKEMRTGMARSWAISTSGSGGSGAIQVLTALGEKSGPLVDYLDVDQRKTLHENARQDFEGSQKTEELDLIKRGIKNNFDLTDSFFSGKLDGATIDANRRSLLEQQKAIKVKMDADMGALAKLGVAWTGYEKSDIPGLIDERLKLVNALDSARRRQTPFDAQDDPSTVNAIMIANDKALKTTNGKDLAQVSKQQALLAVALSDKTVSGGTASTLFKTMSLAMGTAIANAEDPAGWNTFLAWRHPYVAGNMALNEIFKNNAKVKDDIPLQVKIRLAYQGQFNAIYSKEAPISGDDARKLALRAYALEAGDAEVMARVNGGKK